MDQKTLKVEVAVSLLFTQHKGIKQQKCWAHLLDDIRLAWSVVLSLNCSHVRKCKLKQVASCVASSTMIPLATERMHDFDSWRYVIGRAFAVAIPNIAKPNFKCSLHV